MSNPRHPAVAGLFYPADPNELRSSVAHYLTAAGEGATSAPKAIIVPHAGYQYSGPIAASAYACLAAHADAIRRVVLLGPAHRMPFRGIAYSDADTFLTPLGGIPVDRDAIERIADLPAVVHNEAAFEREHCLEVQLPFLQTLLRDFRILPLLVGDADGEAVAMVLDRLWGDDDTLILISSDLSHYHDYATAKAMDGATTRAIADLRPEGVGYEQACGRIPMQGLLLMAKRHGLTPRVLDVRNSGDTAGPRDQVVGYGAYAFY